MAESFYALAVLACPVGMGLMMWFMMRRHKDAQPPAGDRPAATDAELARMRAELDQLQAAQRDQQTPSNTTRSTDSGSA